MHDEDVLIFGVGSLFVDLRLDIGDGFLGAAHFVEHEELAFLIERDDGLDGEHAPHRRRNGRQPSAALQVVEIVRHDEVLDMLPQRIDVIVRFFRRLARVAVLKGDAHERALPHRRRQRIDDIHFELGILLLDFGGGFGGDRLGRGKPARDREVHDVFRALFGELQKVLVVRFVVEHGSARKRAFSKLVIKIDVLLIIGEVVEMIFHLAVLFHREGQRDELDVVLDDKVVIKVTGRIGRQCEFVCHVTLRSPDGKPCIARIFASSARIDRSIIPYFVARGKNIWKNCGNAPDFFAKRS